MNDQVFTLVGFAKKAGRIVIGRSAVQKALDRNQVYLLLIATDASDKISKLFGKPVKVSAFQYADKQQFRVLFDREVAVIGITDQQFASSIKKLLPPEARINFV